MSPSNENGSRSWRSRSSNPYPSGHTPPIPIRQPPPIPARRAPPTPIRQPPPIPTRQAPSISNTRQVSPVPTRQIPTGPNPQYNLYLRGVQRNPVKTATRNEQNDSRRSPVWANAQFNNEFIGYQINADKHANDRSVAHDDEIEVNDLELCQRIEHEFPKRVEDGPDLDERLRFIMAFRPAENAQFNLAFHGVQHNSTPLQHVQTLSPTAQELQEYPDLT